MPTGTEIIAVESSGVSAWTKTAKLSVILLDGSPKKYFLKVSIHFLGNQGCIMDSKIIIIVRYWT